MSFRTALLISLNYTINVGDFFITEILNELFKTLFISSLSLIKKGMKLHSKVIEPVDTTVTRNLVHSRIL